MEIVEAYRRLRKAQQDYNRACNPPNQDAIKTAEEALYRAQEDLDRAVNSACIVEWTTGNGNHKVAVQSEAESEALADSLQKTPGVTNLKITPVVDGIGNQ